MMRGIGRALLLAIVAIIGLPDRPASGQTFLANNGVMYGDGDVAVRVVVDGLFRDEYDIYPPLPDSLRLRFESAQPPFDGITFVLATHRHGDHMHPESVASYLCAAPEAVALVPAEIRDEVLDSAVCDLPPERLVSGTDQVVRRGVAVRAVPVPHTNPDRFADMQNRAYVIESVGGRIVHLGDSNLSEELVAEPVDVLSTPYWNIGEGRFMELWERAGKPFLIAVHVSPGDHDRLRARFEGMDIDVWLPETPMASVENVSEE